MSELNKFPQNTVSERINVLTILTDQQRFDTLSCMGNNVLHTPNLDRLASSGVLFKNAICTNPLCGPARASLLSGLYTHGHGFCADGINVEIYEEGMTEEIETIDELLNKQGYHTEYHGKWHTGKANRGCYFGGVEDFLIEYKEFVDSKYSYPVDNLTGSWKVDRYTKVPYRSVSLDDIMIKAKADGYEMPHDNEAGESITSADDSLTAWTVKKTIDFLRNNPKEPFAVTCSILHPHAPLIAAEPYFNMFDPGKMPMPFNIEDDCKVHLRRSIPDALTLTSDGLGRFISLYYGLIKEVDDWIGKILDELEKSGLRDNTLIVFTSDHGQMLGSHGTLAKKVLFEESIRVPLIMSLPGVIGKNTKSDIPVTGADIMPTILDLLNMNIPGNVQGRSIKKFIVDNKKDDKAFAFCEYLHQRSIRSSEWKLILNPMLESNINERCMLYNLAEDPGEQRNLVSKSRNSDKNRKISLHLKKELINMMEDIGVPDNVVDYYNKFEI